MKNLVLSALLMSALFGYAGLENYSDEDLTVIQGNFRLFNLKFQKSKRICLYKDNCLRLLRDGQLAFDLGKDSYLTVPESDIEAFLEKCAEYNYEPKMVEPQGGVDALRKDIQWEIVTRRNRKANHERSNDGQVCRCSISNVQEIVSTGNVQTAIKDPGSPKVKTQQVAKPERLADNLKTKTTSELLTLRSRLLHLGARPSEHMYYDREKYVDLILKGKRVYMKRGQDEVSLVAENERATFLKSFPDAIELEPTGGATALLAEIDELLACRAEKQKKDLAATFSKETEDGYSVRIPGLSSTKCSYRNGMYKIVDYYGHVYETPYKVDFDNAIKDIKKRGNLRKNTSVYHVPTAEEIAAAKEERERQEALEEDRRRFEAELDVERQRVRAIEDQNAILNDIRWSIDNQPAPVNNYIIAPSPPRCRWR